ncbi:MAG: MarR family transcriptional regulator [Clostridia bacterium]|nr:MarR family transcriptional regulator [Clostridia bacterium]
MDRFSKFTILVNRIVRNIHRIKSDETSKLGLKGTHVSCLYYLYRAESPLTARELCDVCDEDKAAISRAVDFLGREGYVVCESSAVKRYKSPLILTEKGIGAGRHLAERVDSILAEASDGLTDGDREIFYGSLDLISANLQKICDGTGEGYGG